MWVLGIRVELGALAPGLAAYSTHVWTEAHGIPGGEPCGDSFDRRVGRQEGPGEALRCPEAGAWPTDPVTGTDGEGSTVSAPPRTVRTSSI